MINGPRCVIGDMATPALKKLATKSPEQEWTSEDQRECVRLMCKAQQIGVLDNIYHMVRGSSSNSPPMTMSDATKRLRDPEPLVSGYESGAVPTPMPSAEIATLIKQPSMSKTNPDVLDFTMADYSKLPADLKSMDHWSKCLVSLVQGQEVIRPGLPQDDEYKVWLFNHYSTGSAGLIDLVNFLKAMNVPAQKSQGPVIPGSTLTRKLLLLKWFLKEKIIGVLFWVTSNGTSSYGWTLLRRDRDIHHAQARKTGPSPERGLCLAPTVV